MCFSKNCRSSDAEEEVAANAVDDAALDDSDDLTAEDLFRTDAPLPRQQIVRHLSK